MQSQVVGFCRLRKCDSSIRARLFGISVTAGGILRNWWRLGCMWSFHHIWYNDKSPFGSSNIHHSELFPSLFHSFRGDISLIPETDSIACHMICKIHVATEMCNKKHRKPLCLNLVCVSKGGKIQSSPKKKVLVLRSPNCEMHPHVACLVQQGYIKENTCVKTGIHSGITWTSQNEHPFLNHPWTHPN